MTDERRPRSTDPSIWSAIRRDPDEGAIEALWSGLAVSLDATPQKSRRIVDLPWSSGMPGVTRVWPRAAGPAIALLALVALLAVSAVIGLVVASRRLPPPIGLAKPGLIAFDIGGDIFVANADGTGRRVVTSGPADDVQPTWSPDGTRIAFWSLAPGQPFASLAIIDADGSHLRTVATKDLTIDSSGKISLDVYEFAWSPNGRSIAFTGGINQALKIVVASADGTGSSVIGDTASEYQTPAWSPDGSKIVFRGGRSDRDRGVYVMDADGSHIRRLTTPDGTDWGNTDSYFDPVWSPDGGHIAYLRRAGPAYVDSVGWSPLRVWVVDADGSNARMLSFDAYDDDVPVWSPDGSRIAYREWQDGDHARTFVVTSNGVDPIAVGSSVSHSMLSWSPDGSAIASMANDAVSPGADIVVSSIDSRTTVRFPATETDMQTEIDRGDPSWQRLAP